MTGRDRLVRPGLTGAAIGVIVLVGFWLRSIQLQSVPVWTDETDDTLYSLVILQSGHVPLVNFDTFNSSLFNVLEAAALSVSGLSPWAPRVLAWFFCGVTVAATYTLGRAVGGTWTGLLAAALMATSPAAILAGRVAYSNSLTPLCTTAALALLVLALARQDGRRLVLAGLVGGVALQTHVSVVAMLPGALAAVVAWRDWRRRFRWLLPLMAALLIGWAPVIAYNLTSRFESVSYALHHRAPNDRATPLSVPRYATNVGGMFGLLGRTTAGQMNDRRQTTPPLTSLPTLVGIAALLTGTLALAARRSWALLGPLCSALLILPTLNGTWDAPLFHTRYVLPMLPVILVGVALAIQAAHRRVRHNAGRVGLAALALFLVLAPLVLLREYVGGVTQRGFTSDRAFLVARQAEALATGQPILLDESLYWRSTIGSGTALGALHTLLTLADVPHQVVHWKALAAALPTGEPRLAVMTVDSIGHFAELPPEARPELSPAVIPPGEHNYDRFGVYWLRRTEGTDASIHLPCWSAEEPPAQLRPTDCLAGAVHSWQAGVGQDSDRIELSSRVVLLIQPRARADSIFLSELDRVERPVGRSLAAQGEQLPSPDGRLWLSISRPDQIMFLPSADRRTPTPFGQWPRLTTR